jgi:hypothetical protein
MKLRDFMIAFGGLPNLLAVADEVIEWRRCLLHCMSPFMVHFGLGAMSGLSRQDNNGHLGWLHQRQHRRLNRHDGFALLFGHVRIPVRAFVTADATCIRDCALPSRYGL